MKYLWEVMVQAEEQGLPDGQLRFKMAERYSPYTELSLPFLNQSVVGSEVEIEVNPYCRFYEGNLLNNLLSNAVEAAEKKAGDKEVELIIRREGDEIEIGLTNSTAGSVLEKNPNLQSQKKEPELHGLGMASIHRIIETYQEEYTYWEEPHYFFQMIVLKMDV